jgi:hypothetical protein
VRLIKFLSLRSIAIDRFTNLHLRHGRSTAVARRPAAAATRPGGGRRRARARATGRAALEIFRARAARRCVCVFDFDCARAARRFHARSFRFDLFVARQKTLAGLLDFE